MKIYIVRHGETDWNIQQKLQGKTDVSLNNKGISQAHLLGERFKKIAIDEIYTSDLIRAKTTAECIQKAANAGLTVDMRLREQDMGEWEGKTWTTIERDFAELLKTKTQPDFRPPGGESRKELSERVKSFAEEIILESDVENIAVVSHGATIRFLICYFMEIGTEHAGTFTTDNTCVYCFEKKQDGKFHMIINNDTSHIVYMERHN